MDDATRTLLAGIIRVLGVVSLLVCVGMVTTAGLTYHHTRAWVAGATRVQGTVVAVEEGSTSEDEPVYTTVVRFTDADGGEHEVRSRVQESPAPFEVRDAAEVVYPPGRPGEARIDMFGELWLLPLVFGLGAVLTSPLGGLMQFVEGAGTLLGGLSVLAGVHISMRLCRAKMAEETDQVAAQRADGL